jgi:biotin transport system substrate-specific component
MQNTIAFHATQRLRPQYAVLTDISLIILGSFFVAAMAQLTFYLPFSPVPITGQTFAVLIIGMLFGARRGAAVLLLYIAEGLAGLPVFAGARAGIATLIGPTGGYLIGFVAAAFVVGYLAERGAGKNLLNTLTAFLIGSAIIYLFGVAWLSTLLGLREAIAAGMTPFLIGDAVKALSAALLLPAAWKLIR